MLNKKLLAVAVTAAMTQGIAFANPNQVAFDLDGATGDFPDSTAVQYPTELTWDSERAIVENDNGTASHFTANIGFSIAEGTNKYIRIDLGNGATFQTAPRLVWDTVAAEQARPVNAGNTDVQNYPVTDIPNPQSSISEGGQGANYVVFEVNAFENNPAGREDIPRWLSFYVEVDQYNLSTDGCTTARYRLFEDAVDAQKEDDSQTLKDTGADDAMCFTNGVVNDFTIPNNAYASVDSEYTVFIHANSQFADHDETNYYDEQQSGNDTNNDGMFDGVGTWAGAAVSATTASLGEVDTDLLAPAGNGFTDLDGGAFNNVDVIGTDPVVKFNGDFSFGEWTMREVTTTPAGPAGDSCSVGTDILPDPASTMSQLVFSTISQADLEANDYVLCVDVAGMDSDVTDNLLVGSENPWMTGNKMNRIGESTYSANISWDALTDNYAADAISTNDGWEEAMGAMPNSIDDTMGEIIYDSITVDVPFMSTFTDYKQRFHLTNTGPTPAKYMFEFTPENGTVVTAGAMATGVIPAGESIVVQTADIIASFTGRSRTAAQLHIGGEDEDIGVSAVVVNPEKGTIDIQDLNANSIKARKSNFLPEANNVTP
ncbi:hypothetical protein KUL42_42250 [Alteromonas sp. KUL42]|uniref:hypothetical protein n=1 Tax=Alteromonas sp. KUL42 TaxID=2480797 RepID=UPI0010360623|nr:hypothetical protein [Alteromonas sp. KUL42]TAP31368.1 hypothetical protein EYR97_20960 [Alteromonas sp. KUL42]GEA09464.1 hypothetical protein KUL42_42250 [Alteromonas sp. KUL42]